jgi:hypothetical protein
LVGRTTSPVRSVSWIAAASENGFSRGSSTRMVVPCPVRHFRHRSDPHARQPDARQSPIPDPKVCRDAQALGVAERLKHLRNEVPRNAFAAIGYDESSDCAGFGQADRDASAGRREFQSVGYQITNVLLDPVFIGKHGSNGFDCRLKRHTLLGRSNRGAFQGALGERCQHNALALHAELSHVNARRVEQITDYRASSSALRSRPATAPADAAKSAGPRPHFKTLTHTTTRNNASRFAGYKTPWTSSPSAVAPAIMTLMPA